MRVTIAASNGAEIVIWCEHHTYFARRAGEVSEPQICLAVDLFEVIAELAALDLEREDQAAEALALAEYAQRAVRAPDLDDETAAADTQLAADTRLAADDQRDAS